LTSLLLESLKRNITALELEPHGGGCFEVFVDDEQIYSKLETGEFPDERQILDQISEKVG